MDDFPGKEDFAQFYLAHNGGCFRRARFYPEECYTDSINGIVNELYLCVLHPNLIEYTAATKSQNADTICVYYNSYVEMDLSFVYTARQKDLPNSCASRTLQFPFVRLCA